MRRTATSARERITWPCTRLTKTRQRPQTQIPLTTLDLSLKRRRRSIAGLAGRRRMAPASSKRQNSIGTEATPVILRTRTGTPFRYSTSLRSASDKRTGVDQPETRLVHRLKKRIVDAIDHDDHDQRDPDIRRRVIPASALFLGFLRGKGHHRAENHQAALNTCQYARHRLPSAA